VDLIDELIVALAVLALLWAFLVLALVIAGRHSVATEVARFLPNLVRLFRALSRDPRVPRRAKIAVAAGLVYLALPIDVIPDFIPVAGHADDAIVAALILRFVLSSTTRDVLYQHWAGDPRTLDRLLRLARV
jgi:uncharacterized membrane protein YkvA (DUF1232 family)